MEPVKRNLPPTARSTTAQTGRPMVSAFISDQTAEALGIFGILSPFYRSKRRFKDLDLFFAYPNSVQYFPMGSDFNSFGGSEHGSYNKSGI